MPGGAYSSQLPQTITGSSKLEAGPLSDLCVGFAFALSQMRSEVPIQDLGCDRSLSLLQCLTRHKEKQEG